MNQNYIEYEDLIFKQIDEFLYEFKPISQQDSEYWYGNYKDWIFASNILVAGGPKMHVPWQTLLGKDISFYRIQNEIKIAEAKVNAIIIWFKNQDLKPPEFDRIYTSQDEFMAMEAGYDIYIENRYQEKLEKIKNKFSQKEKSSVLKVNLNGKQSELRVGEDGKFYSSKSASLKTLRENISGILNLKWRDIKIELMTDSVIRFKIIESGKKAIRINYTDMGMNDNRKTDMPDRLWIMLEDLIDNDGKTSKEQMKFLNRSKTEKTISQLRKKLKEVTGLKDNPILFNKTEGYTVQFKVEDSRTGSYHSI